MTARTIKVSAPNINRTLEITYDFGDSLDDKVRLFGENVTNNHAENNMVIALQQVARTMLERGIDKDSKARDMEKFMSNEQIVEKLSTWKPEVSRNSDPQKKVDNIKKLAASLTPEQRAAIIATLTVDMKPEMVPAKELVERLAEAGKKKNKKAA